MKKGTKKIVSGIISMVLAVVMVVTMLPTGSFSVAADDLGIDIELNSYQINGTSGEQGTIKPVVKYGATVITHIVSVSYTSTDSDIISVDSDGAYILKKEGTAVVKVAAEYEVAGGSSSGVITLNGTQSVAVTVKKPAGTLNVTPSSGELLVGESLKISPVEICDEMDTATVVRSYSSSRDDVATVDNNGTVAAVAPGKAVITVKSEFQDTYGNSHMYTKDVDITVAKPEISLVGGLEQTVEITEDNPNPIVTFKANTSNTNDTVVYTLTPNDATKAELGENSITFHEPGMYTLTATLPTGNVSASIIYKVVKVEKQTPKPTITSSAKEVEINLSETDSFNLKSILTSSEPVIDYDISSPKAQITNDIISFSEVGYYTVKASVSNTAGSANTTIIFHVTDTTKKDSGTISINGADSFSLSEVGATVKAEVSVTEYSISDVSWESNNTKVAGVTNGIITANGEGTAIITATIPNGQYVTFTVNVKVSSLEIELNQPVSSIEVVSGEYYSENLKKYISFKNNNGDVNKDLAWRSSDESIVQVVDGYVLGKNPGIAVVIAYTADGYSVSFPVTVIGKPELSASVTEYTVDMKDVNAIAGFGIDLSSVISLKNSNEVITYETSNNTILDVNNSGFVTFKNVGIAYVTAKAGNEKITFTFHVIDTTVPEPIRIVYTTNAEKSFDMVLGQEPKDLIPSISLVQDGVLSAPEVNSENVKWSSDNEKVATVVNGMVTPVSGGKAVITATTKDGYFVTFSINVLVKPTVAFGFNKAEVVEGTAVDVAVKIAPEYANVTYEVELDGQTADTSTYMLAENGDSITFTPLVNGNFIVKARVTADGTSFSKTAELSVKSLKDVDSITFTENNKILYTGDSFDLSSLVLWNGGTSEPYNTDITWTSANEEVVSVDKAGIIKAKKAGMTVIYAQSYNNKRAKITIEVLQQLENIILSKDSISLWEGESDDIEITPVPADADYEKVEYSSEDDSIATVDASGEIKAISGGKTNVVVTAKYTDKNGNQATIVRKVKVLVKASVKSVEIRTVSTDSPDTIYSKKIGDKVQLKAVITPVNAYDKKVLWSAEDDGIATVDANGIVTTKGKGTTYIYAKCTSDGYGMDGNGTPAVGMIKIIVGGDEYSLNITPERSIVYPGEQIKFDADLLPENAVEGKVTWSADSSDISLDSKGYATVSPDASAGLITVTATMKLVDGDEYKAEALVYVKTPVKTIEFEKSSMNLYIYEDVNLSPVFNGGTTVPSDTNINWSVKDSSILSVDSYGKVYAKKLGSTWVYATAYNGKRAEIFINVIAAPKSIKLSRHGITCYSGERKNISYTFNPDYTTQKAVTWTSTNKDVAYYDTASKKIVAVSGGTCYITVTANDTHFGNVSDRVKVVVKQRTTGIEISKSKLTKKVGNMFKLSATVKPSNAYNKAIYWTSSNVAVASVDEFGIVTCHKKGKATITALTTDGYGAKCKLTVKKGKTKIKYGVTNVNGLYIRKSPSLQGVQLGQYNAGVSVTIVGKVGEWYKIKYKSEYAYLRSAYVTVLTSTGSSYKGNKSNAVVSSTTGIYTGVGTGFNTEAPKGTRVLVVNKVGNYYKIKYGTNALGTGYVAVNSVSLDSGFKYGIATPSKKITKKKVSSTPNVTLFRTARVSCKTAIYSNARGTGRKLGIVSRNTRLVLNSQKINGYYQVVFSNGVIGYVKGSKIKKLKSLVKRNVNKTNTFIRYNK